MTTRLPQEVYEELGFTHEQFENAMAMVQELGSNRAADKAMGLSSGTVARWARAWLLASRALEENPQADPREILAGLKLSRRANLGGLQDPGGASAMVDPDSPQAIEALKAFRRGAGLAGGEQDAALAAGESIRQAQTSVDEVADASGSAAQTVPPFNAQAGGAPLMTGLLDGVSARPRRVQRFGPAEPPNIPRSLTGQGEVGSVAALDEGLSVLRDSLNLRDVAGGVGDPQAPAPPATSGNGLDSSAVAHLQEAVEAIGREALKPDAMAGLIDQVRRDIADLSQLTQQGLASNDQQAIQTQSRLEALAQSFQALSELADQWSRFDSQFGDGLRASLEPASALLRQIIDQHAGFATQILQLQQSQKLELQQIDPNYVSNRLDSLIGQLDLLASAADLGLVREQLASLQQLLQTAPLSSSGGQTSSLGADAAQVQQLMGAMDARLEQYWSNIQSRLEQIYTQGSGTGASLRNDLASKHQVEMLRSELPEQFSTLNVRLEAMLNQQAEEIRLHARVPAAVTERLQSQLSDLGYSIGRLLDKGQHEAESIIQEARQIFGETRSQIDQSRTLIDQQISQLGHQVSENVSQLGHQVSENVSQLGHQVRENISQLGEQFTKGLVDVGRQLEQFDQRVDATIESGLNQTQSLFVETRSLVEASQQLIIDRGSELGLAREQIQLLQSQLNEFAATASQTQDVRQIQTLLEALDQQFSVQIQRLEKILVESNENTVSRGSQLQSELSGQISAEMAGLLAQIEQSATALAQVESRLPEVFDTSFQTVSERFQAGLDILSTHVTALQERGSQLQSELSGQISAEMAGLLAQIEQSATALAQVESRLPEVFDTSFQTVSERFQAGLDILSTHVTAWQERGTTDLGELLEKLKQDFEGVRNLLIERTEILVPALEKLVDLGSGQEKLHEGVSQAQSEIQRLLESNRALLIDRSEVLAGALAQLNDLRVPIASLEQRVEGVSQTFTEGLEEIKHGVFERVDGPLLALQDSFSEARSQLAGLQSAFADATAFVPRTTDINAISEQLSQIQQQFDREAQNLNGSLERVPAQFSELSARIEAWFRSQAERSVEAESRLPDAVVSRLQNSWDGVTEAVAEVARRGFGESSQLFSEAKDLLESSKALIDERTDLLSLGITDVGSQLSQMDQKLGGVADRISALLAYLQRGGGEKLAALMRDAEQKGLRIEQEQRDATELQIRLLRDLRAELGARLEQINAGLQQPVELFRQGLSSSADALRGIIATGLDSVSVQLISQQQVASERMAKLLDDVSLTAIRIEQGQHRESTVLRSDIDNLARDINSDLQQTRDAFQINLAGSLSEVREIGVMQQRSLSEILSQLQEQTATLMQSLSVSLEGLDKSFLNHIEKFTGGQASMRENFADLAKTSLAFRRSSEQLSSLSRSIGRIERLANDVAGFGGQIQSLAQTAEKLQTDSRRSQQLEDQIVRLQASFQAFASSIARIDTLGPFIEQLHQESLKKVDFNAYLESIDARFHPLATQAYAEKSTKLIATDLSRLQQISAALQNLIEQHLQRLQVLEITLSQQIAERIEEGIRQQSLLREDLLNRAAQQDDLLRLSVSQLVQNLEKVTSPLARAELIQQGIGQLKELQVGYQVQLEETSKQRQRELLDLLQGGQDAVASTQRDSLRQLLDAGQDRFNRLLQSQTQLFEKQRDQQNQQHEIGQRSQQQWFDQAQTLIRRNHETLVGLAETQHQQSELLERDLHEQIQGLQRQHFTILKQLQDQNHSQVQSLQNNLQEKTEQLIRQLNADAQRSVSAEFNDVRQVQEQLTNALTERFEQSLENIVSRSERGFMQLEALQPLLDQLRTDMLRPRHIEQVIADVRRELESVPRNIDMQSLQDRLSSKLGMSKDQLAAALVSVKDELSGLVESGNSRLFGISLTTEKLSERSEVAMGKLDHLTASLESVRTDTLRTRISDQNIGLERVTNLVNALQERLGAGLDTVLDRVMGMLTQQDKLAERTEDAQGRLQSLVSLAIEQAVADIRRELYGVVRDSGLSAFEDRVRTAIGDLQSRLVAPSDMAATQLNELRAHADRLNERVDQSLQRVDVVMGLTESMRAEALRPRHLDQALSELRREFGPLARGSEIETVSERLRTLGLSSGKVEDQVTRIRAGLQGLENAYAKLDVLSSQVEQSRAESVKEQHIVEAVSVIRRDVEPLIKAGELSSMMVNTLLERLNSVNASNAKLEDRAQRLHSEMQMMHSEISELRSMLSRIESKLER